MINRVDKIGMATPLEMFNTCVSLNGGMLRVVNSLPAEDYQAIIDAIRSRITIAPEPFEDYNSSEYKVLLNHCLRHGTRNMDKAIAEVATLKQLEAPNKYSPSKTEVQRYVESAKALARTGLTAKEVLAIVTPKKPSRKRVGIKVSRSKPYKINIPEGVRFIEDPVYISKSLEEDPKQIKKHWSVVIIRTNKRGVVEVVNDMLMAYDEELAFIEVVREMVVPLNIIAKLVTEIPPRKWPRLL